MYAQGIHIDWAIRTAEDWLPRITVDFMCTDYRSYEPSNGGHKVMVF